MSMTRPTTEQITHNGQILKDVLGPVTNVLTFGAKGDGVTDDTAAVAAALASLTSGGALYFPRGTYRIFRNNAGDNIVSDNVTIFGDGPATVINGYQFGNVPNSDFGQNQNIFQATGRTNITIRDMSFYGSCAPVAMWECTNVRVTGIVDDAQLTPTSSGDPFTITNITVSANPVITYSGTDPVSGFNSHYVISGVVGMTQINGQTITVANLNTTAKTFSVGGMAESIPLSTAGYSAYVSGGTATRATNYMRDKSVYVHKCTDVLVHGCRFLNNKFGVYVSGDNAQRTSRCIVSNCHFEHTTPAGQFQASYPCAVYWYYSEDCAVTNCTFIDIYSSQVRGTSGIGAGYAIYEGDGESGHGIVSGNRFIARPKGDLTGNDIYANEMQGLNISGNTFERNQNGVCVWLDSKNQDSQFSVTGNNFDCISTAGSILLYGLASTSPSLLVSSNTIRGGRIGIDVLYCGLGKHVISNNLLENQSGQGIRLWGLDGQPHRNVLISGNRIVGSAGQAILCNARCIATHIIGNVILDGNTANQAGDAGSAIYFITHSYGSTIVGNTIGNTPYGGGKFTYGVTNAADETTRIFKDITAANSFVGLPDGAQIRFDRFWSSSPTNGIYDINQGELVENTDIDAGDSPGWYCVFKRTPELSSNASSASTTVTVSSTSGFASGDIVLITKKKNMYDTSYYTATEWHVDTIASVTDATNFVLTTGIPAGDGTYVAGTAGVYVARFKAAAVIAS